MHACFFPFSCSISNIRSERFGGLCEMGEIDLSIEFGYLNLEVKQILFHLNCIELEYNLDILFMHNYPRHQNRKDAPSTYDPTISPINQNLIHLPSVILQSLP